MLERGCRRRQLGAGASFPVGAARCVRSRQQCARVPTEALPRRVGRCRPRRRTLTRGVRMQPTVMLRRPRGSRLRGLTPRCSCTSRRPFPNCAALRTWRGPCRLARACAFDAQPASVLLSAHASALRSRLRICSVCSARKRQISSSSCGSLLATPPPRRLQSRPFASSARPD